MTTVEDPYWQCPGCGVVLYYVGSMHHIGGCDEHPGCEKYKEAQYRTSHMWPLDWSPEESEQPAEKLKIPPLRMAEQYAVLGESRGR